MKDGEDNSSKTSDLLVDFMKAKRNKENFWTEAKDNGQTANLRTKTTANQRPLSLIHSPLPKVKQKITKLKMGDYQKNN